MTGFPSRGSVLSLWSELPALRLPGCSTMIYWWLLLTRAQGRRSSNTPKKSHPLLIPRQASRALAGIHQGVAAQDCSSSFLLPFFSLPSHSPGARPPLPRSLRELEECLPVEAERAFV